MLVDENLPRPMPKVRAGSLESVPCLRHLSRQCAFDARVPIPHGGYMRFVFQQAIRARATLGRRPPSSSIALDGEANSQLKAASADLNRSATNIPSAYRTINKLSMTR